MCERLLEHSPIEAKESKNFKEGAAKCCLLQEARANGPGTGVQCVSVILAEDRVPWNLGMEVKE